MARDCAGRKRGGMKGEGRAGWMGEYAEQQSVRVWVASVIQQQVVMMSVCLRGFLFCEISLCMTCCVSVPLHLCVHHTLV